MKKNFILVTTMLTACLSLTGCHLNHEWQEATCTQPRTCTIGGETEGEPLGHTWVDATCTEAKTCSVCGETEGEPLGHTWADATCTEPKTCSVCGETEGEPLGHTWADATCTEPKTCTVCGETEGKPINHNIDYKSGKCTMCNQQIIDVEQIYVNDFSKNFNITYTSTATSPCTISVEPKASGYEYSYGFVALKIYQGKKATYGGSAEYANSFRENVDIYLDEKGCGSAKVTFPDYGYYIRGEIDNAVITRYKNN